SEKGGEQRRMDFDKPEVTIGRVQGNDIILPKGNVSKRHSRIVLKDGKFIIVDLKSTNGTYVNGRKITSPLVLKDSDKVYIGDFILTVEDSGMGVGAVSQSATATPIPPPVPPTSVYLEPANQAPPSAPSPSVVNPSLVANPPPVPRRPGPPPVPGRRSESSQVDGVYEDADLSLPPRQRESVSGARLSAPTPAQREPSQTREIGRD